MEAANGLAVDYQRCAYSLLCLYILLNLQNPDPVCCSERQTCQKMSVLSLDSYLCIYTISQLSFCIEQRVKCVFVCDSVLRAVERINVAIRKGEAEETVNELMNPDAQLPQVYPTAADLYQRELACLQQQSPEVRTHPQIHSHLDPH